MKLPPWIVSLLGVAVILAMPVFLALSNANLFMAPWFVQYEYSKPDFPSSTRFDPEARAKFSVATVRYTRGEMNDAALRELRVYNERELSHMRDVQTLVGQLFGVNYILGGMILLALIALWRGAAPAQAIGALFNGGILTAIVLGAVGLFALFAFDSFFIVFHRIFFIGDSWLFPVTDSLIQFYPLPLWVDASLSIPLLTLLEVIVLVVVTFDLRRRLPATHLQQLDRSST